MVQPEPENQILLIYSIPCLLGWLLTWLGLVCEERPEGAAAAAQGWGRCWRPGQLHVQGWGSAAAPELT